MNLGRFELCLKVAVLADSRKFYESLGFQVVGGDEGEGWLQLKSASLALALYQGHIPSNLLNFRGADVFAVADELTRRGLELEKPAELEQDGSAGAWLKDPDGNVIYFNTSPEEKP
jgi:catechol 2,3-dioxygenase-like lactoylglutathione lyase family enzyme